MTQMSIETNEAPAAVSKLLEHNDAICRELGEILRATPPTFVATCARGSSDHAATFAKYIIETHTGTVTASSAPSVSSVYGAQLRMAGALFIGISQSGQSPDLLATARAARKAGAMVVVIVNVTESPLAQLADFIIPLWAGPETSVAATKSYIATLSAIVQIVAHWSQDKTLLKALELLPQQLNEANRLDWSSAVPALSQAQHLLVVGRAAGFGVAQEAALKFKETCRLHAEAFSAAEIRHGPMAILKNTIATLVFSQKDETQPSIEQLATLLRQQGGPVFTAGLVGAGQDSLPCIEDVHPAIAPITMAQSFYHLVNQVSLARGLDPDHPPLLRKVTETT